MGTNFTLDFWTTLLGVFWLRRSDPMDSPQTTDMVCLNPLVYSTMKAAKMTKGCTPRR